MHCTPNVLPDQMKYVKLGRQRLPVALDAPATSLAVLVIRTERDEISMNRLHSSGPLQVQFPQTRHSRAAGDLESGGRPKSLYGGRPTLSPNTLFLLGTPTGNAFEGEDESPV